MSILIISPEIWASNFVSKHHYALALARNGSNVLFLDPPDNSLSCVLIEPTESNPNLLRVRGPRVAIGLQWMPGFIRRWLEGRWLQKLEAKTGLRIDVIWLFENSRFYDMSFAGPRLKIYHQVDLNQNFHPEISARSADICLFSSDLILRQLESFNEHSYFIQHGVAVTTSVPLIPSKIPAFSQKYRPRVAYVGNLNIPYLDVEVFVAVVKSQPCVEFHLVGCIDHNSLLYQSLCEYSNVVWWGQVRSDLIPTILAEMDILMLCYSQQYEKQVSNPHKIMEYLASGKTIVATYTDQYRNSEDLLVMCDAGSNEDYVQLFDSVLLNLYHYNSPEMMAARRAYAGKHTYPRQVERIKSLLDNLGFCLLSH